MRYLSVRLGLVPVTLLGAVTVVFVLLRVVPGDPATAILGDLATTENVAQLRKELGLDRPLVVQYLAYLRAIVVGDLGRSTRSGTLVVEEIAGRLPLTVLLAVEATGVSLLLGIPLGVAAARHRGRLIDVLTRVAAVTGVSLPAFWLGIMVLYLFAVRLDLFPVMAVGGLGSVGAALHRSVLPAWTLGIINAALIARMTRSSVLDVDRLDYVRTARAKGLSERRVTYRHALRTALIPVVTIAGLNAGRMLGGAVVVETVFSWPGLGGALIDAMRTRDYPVIQGTILVFAASFVVVNLLVDLLYARLDPRVRYQVP